jgi:hypothetical protein
MSLSHYVERLSVDRSHLKPIEFYDEPTETLIERKQKLKEAQVGIVVKLNTVQRAKFRRKKWLLQNKKRVNVTRKLWTARNIDKMKAYWCEYRKTDKYKENVKRWRDNNREKYNAYQLRWLNENREKRQRQQRERAALRYKTDAAYRLKRSEQSKRYNQKRKEREKHEAIS